MLDLNGPPSATTRQAYRPSTPMELCAGRWASSHTAMMLCFVAGNIHANLSAKLRLPRIHRELNCSAVLHNHMVTVSGKSKCSPYIQKDKWSQAPNAVAQILYPQIRNWARLLTDRGPAKADLTDLESQVQSAEASPASCQL